MRTLLRLLALVATVVGEAVFEDSPTLTALWQASSEGSTDAFINQVIQNRDCVSHRSGDGRGPMFWAYEFKNVDTLALLTHLGVTADQQDVEGKGPKEFFPDGAAEMAEFEADAKAKVEELGKLLSEREEEFYSYQNAAPADDDYDDEDDADAGGEKKASSIDAIDYADDEDEDDDVKDEM